jgi:hypothetical protein
MANNWKTTVSGIVSSAAGLVLALQAGGVSEPKWLVVTAGFVLAGGLAGLGIAAQDGGKTETVAGSGSGAVMQDGGKKA